MKILNLKGGRLDVTLLYLSPRVTSLVATIALVTCGNSEQTVKPRRHQAQVIHVAN